MTFSALDSGLTGPLFASDAMRAVFSDRAALAAMLEAETALARAEARRTGWCRRAWHRRSPASSRTISTSPRSAAGQRSPASSPSPSSRRSRRSCRRSCAATSTRAPPARTSSTPPWSCRWPKASNSSLPTSPPSSTDSPHWPANTARTRWSGGPTASTPRRSRSDTSPALWLSGIAEVAADLPALRQRALVVSLGRAGRHAGGSRRQGPGRARRFRRRTRPRDKRGPLAHQPRPHGRGRMLAGDPDRGAGQDGDRRGAPRLHRDRRSGRAAGRGRGGSSAMPHKRNPVSATVILSAQAAAAGYVVTLLNAAARPAAAGRRCGRRMARPAPALFGLASGALREARRLAEGLEVDAGRMRANLDMTGGLHLRRCGRRRAGRAAGPRGRAGHRRARRQRGPQDRPAAATGARRRRQDSRAAARAVRRAFDLRPATVAAAAAVADRAIRQARTVQRMLGKG